MATTTIQDLINPEVMTDMISAKIPKKIRVAPFAKLDTTLNGQPGDTITVPTYAYIGDAEDVAEGVKAGTTKLTHSTAKAKVKKAMKAVTLTDEALLSGYGDPVGEVNNQLAASIASKVDNDCLDALLNVETQIYDSKAKKIGYDSIVDGIDLFDEEINTNKVMFINPKQVTDLRKDPNFLSADKYIAGVTITGEIGKIANTMIVPSKKIELDEAGTFYSCPIIKLDEEEETEQETPAITIYLKRDINLETERETLARSTTISVDEHYTAVVSNSAKVVLAQFKK